MPKAYWVATYRSINNPDALAAYAKLAGPALQAAGGRFVARGLPTKAFELGVMERVVIIEFDSAEAASEKFAAGAQLVQVYTGFIYQGPNLIRSIVTSL